jgi:hypothetical protein
VDQIPPPCPSNLGVVSARWVLTNPIGTIVFSYAWILGLTSNNQVEAYVFLQGVNLSSSIRIQNMIIISDSKITTMHLIEGSSPQDSKLSAIFSRIQDGLRYIPPMDFFHVFHENNSPVDFNANEAIKRSEGDILINNNIYKQSIP